jgi:hypothetical protein
MAETDFLRVAREFARSKGRDVERYDVMAVHVAGGACSISFQGKNGAPGDHFTVVVDVATGRPTQFIPGE